MKNSPLVSAVIIFYNSDKYLAEAIESVIGQTYNNWELFLCDDGSTDGSTDIALHYQEKFPSKIKYLQHEGHVNRGRSAARNLGIQEAKGEVIALLDSDDVWLPDKLGEQISLLNENPMAGMIYGRTEVWYSWCSQYANGNSDYLMTLGVEPNRLIAPPNLFVLHLENKVQSPTTCNVMIRKEVIDDVGLFQDDFKGMFEDLAFFSKITLKYPVYVSDRCWARYRQHEESICAISDKEGNSWKDRLPILDWLEDYLIAERIQDKRVWRALRKQLFPYRHEKLFLLMNDPLRLFRRVKRRGFSIIKNLIS